MHRLELRSHSTVRGGAGTLMLERRIGAFLPCGQSVRRKSWRRVAIIIGKPDHVANPRLLTAADVIGRMWLEKVHACLAAGSEAFLAWV